MNHFLNTRHKISIFCILLCTLTKTCCSLLSAPTSVSISGVTFKSFEVTYDDVSGACSYQVTITAIHDPSNSVNNTTSETSLIVTEKKSNINYQVIVRGLDVNGSLGNPSTAVRVRTAPGGSSVLYAITTPTFITVFLEETPGATAWEIEYTNRATGETNTLQVPTGTPSNTLYVAIIQPLNPNTEYSIRVRVSQINSVINYNITQSPYGDSVNYTTDRLFAFGRIELMTRNYSEGDNVNKTLKDEIAMELLAAYRNVSNDVFIVSVIELEEYPGTTNTLCHHEILLNNQSTMLDVTGLAFDDPALYQNQVARYNALKRLKDFKWEDGTPYNILSAVDLNNCDFKTDMRKWTLFDKTGQIQSSVLDITSCASKLFNFFLFSNSGIRQVITGENVVFTLSPNSIYAVKHDYLLKNCVTQDCDVTMYNRNFGAFNDETTPESSKYAIFYSTDVAASILNTTIEYISNTEGTAVTLKVPATFAARAIKYEFTVDGTAMPNLTLNEEDLDNSNFYMVVFPGLTADAEIKIDVTVTARHHDGDTSRANVSVDVTPDINECLSTTNPDDCASKAKCTNMIGSFVCTCSDGYIGNGTFCEDIDECASTYNFNNCHVNATCMNTKGNFTCGCNSGYSGDGLTCYGTDECTNSDKLLNCDENAAGRISQQLSVTFFLLFVHPALVILLSGIIH